MLYDWNILGTTLSIKIFSKIVIVWPCRDICHLLIKDCLCLAWQLIIKDAYIPSSITQISFITFLHNPLSLFILCRWLKQIPDLRDHRKSPTPPLISNVLSKRSQRTVSPSVGLPCVKVSPTLPSWVSLPTLTQSTGLLHCSPVLLLHCYRLPLSSVS